MNTQSRKIAGFMTAEGIYSLAFYIVMVAAIAGIGAGVLVKKDSAKAASAISLLRANFMAEGATLGYTPIPAAAADAANMIIRLSGNLLKPDDPATVTKAMLPGGGEVALILKTAGTAAGGFAISVSAIQKPDICTAIAGVGFGTWVAVATGAAPSAGGNMTDATASALKNYCTGATTAAPVVLNFASN